MGRACDPEHGDAGTDGVVLNQIAGVSGTTFGRETFLEDPAAGGEPQKSLNENDVARRHRAEKREAKRRKREERRASKRVKCDERHAEERVLIGDFANGATLFVREGVNVRISDSDQDDFTRNKVTVLAEGRFGLAVWEPGFFASVALTGGT